MNRSGHGRTPITRLAQPTNVAARITITVFTDGRPPDIQSTVQPLEAIQIWTMGINNAVKFIQEAAAKQRSQGPPQDKERKYLGPRGETAVWGPDGEKKSG